MNIKELIKNGQLDETRRQLVEILKKSPADPGSRTLFFQTLCYCGEWEKAGRHLEAIAAQDPGRAAGVEVCRKLIQAEQERSRVAAGACNASFPGEPPAWAELSYALREALKHKKIAAARELLERLEAALPAVSGRVNGNPFSGFRETDTLLLPFLEVFAHERYLWVPFTSLRELSIEPPATWLDLLWIPASLTTWQGLTMNCFLPVLYPDTCLEKDERLRLGRMTDWAALGGPYTRGRGQHVFEIGGEDVSILDIRQVEFNFSGTEISDEENN
ncbi:MAG TPA: hypothetical protein ENK33_08815 [Desulfobacterales bacterium]|nr:hypothetical protein [Desulfobacterales bacterium]